MYFPWNRLASEAVLVEIENIYVLAHPLDKGNWDEVEVLYIAFFGTFVIFETHL